MGWEQRGGGGGYWRRREEATNDEFLRRKYIGIRTNNAGLQTLLAHTAHFTYGSNWGDALQAVLQAVLQAGPIVRCFGRDLLPVAEVTAALALLEAEGRASFFSVDDDGGLGG